MERIIIATCRAWPQGNASLQQLAQRLPATLLPWTDIPLRNLATTTILPLAVWDYSEQPAQYLRRLGQFRSLGAHILNPPALQRWNIDKCYLIELAQHGLPVTPSRILPAAAAADWKKILAALPWENPVIKPLIGQSGRGVRRLAKQPPTAEEYPFGALVQPYIRAPDGEACLLYLRGQYSHAVRRLPADGEWRANSAYGVRILPCDAPAHWRQTAARILAALPEMPHYARIDGLITPDGGLLVNEVELIEPALYLTDENMTIVQSLIKP